jgi:prophage regulatory protein
MVTRLIGLTEVIERVRESRSEIYRKIRGGSFPRPVKVGERRIAFIEDEIEAYQAARVAALITARDAAFGPPPFGEEITRVVRDKHLPERRRGRRRKLPLGDGRPEEDDAESAMKAV